MTARTQSPTIAKIDALRSLFDAAREADANADTKGAISRLCDLAVAAHALEAEVDQMIDGMLRDPSFVLE